MTKPVSVMIVEDSPVVRVLLEHIIGSDPRFVIAASVETAEEALERLDEVQPDVISLDIRLPGMNGLDATLQIMQTRPTPIVVVAANVEHDELNIAMNALRAGALTVVEKPVGVSHADYEAVAEDLRRQLVIMSQIKVVRQARRRGLSFGSPVAAGVAEAAPPPSEDAQRPRPALVGITASTGGPNALSKVLNGLGPFFPLPIVIVQHITPSFHEGFIGWLSDVTPFKVRAARDREVPQPGHVYLAPLDCHISVGDDGLRLRDTEPVSNQRPSGTVLFESMASALGARGVGVLLTGMGDDGAKGLLAMHRAGAMTIAEHESTAVIYGMPAEAVRLGAAREVLPLDRIAQRLSQLAATEG